MNESRIMHLIRQAYLDGMRDAAADFYPTPSEKKSWQSRRTHYEKKMKSLLKQGEAL